MNAAEITLLVLLVLSLLLSANTHGKPETGRKSFWVSLTANILMYGLMYLAGLFH